MSRADGWPTTTDQPEERAGRPHRSARRLTRREIETAEEATIMNPQILTLRRRSSAALAFVCAIAIGPVDALAFAWNRAPAAAESQTYPQAQQPQPTQAQAETIPANQLDSLVAPIALYPDPL